MCDPVSIGLSAAAVSGALSIGNTLTQAAQASQQQEFQNQIAERNRQLALQSQQNTFSQLGDLQAQQAAAAAAEISSIRRESELAQSTVAAGAAEAGVGGASLTAIFDDFERQESEFVTAQELNLQFAQQQAQTEKVAAQIGTSGRLIAALPSQVPRPNLFGAALGTFTSSLSIGVGAFKAAKSGAFGRGAQT